MKNIRRMIGLLLAGCVVAMAASGCVVVPERGYYHDGYNNHYWER